MDVRVFTVDDAAIMKALRVRALREEPEAFGSSWEEESKRPLEQTIARLQASDTTAFGAFDDNGALVGMVRLWRQDGVKSQHKAAIISMYVRQRFVAVGWGGCCLRPRLRAPARHPASSN